MDFAHSPKAQETCANMWEFMREHVFPAERTWHSYLAEHGAHATPPVIEEEPESRPSKRSYTLKRPRLRHGF